MVSDPDGNTILIDQHVRRAVFPMPINKPVTVDECVGRAPEAGNIRGSRAATAVKAG